MDTTTLAFQPVGFTADGATVPLVAEIEAEHDGGLTRRRLTVRGEGPRPMALHRVRLLEIDLGAEAVEVFRGGYYMPSDPAGFFRVQAGQPAPQAGAWKPQDLDPHLFWCYSLAVADVPGQGRLLAGFTTFERFGGFLAFDTRGATVKLSAWCDTEGLTVAADRPLRLEALALAEAPELPAALARYADCLARIHGSRMPAETVTGWVDWQYYREQKTEADVLRTVEAMKALRAEGHPLQYVIVDAGWCDHCSEWLAPSSKFPSGLAALSQRLHGEGFRFGLWFAPYLVNVQTELARRHPDWCVLDRETGEPLFKPHSNVGPCYVVDFSVPEALDWLRDTVRHMVREWGIDYLKLDGPALGHYRGGRLHDPEATTLSQVRRSLEVIREVCGDQVLVEGEGVYGPALGLVEIQRVQQDPHPYWDHPETGQPVLREHLNNELATSYLHGRVWHNHRENVILRDYPSPFHTRGLKNPALREGILTENELRFQLTVAALSGGAMLLCDPLDELRRNPARIELISQFLPHGPAGVEPVDVFGGDGRQPALWHLPLTGPLGAYHVVAVLNRDDRYEDFTVPLDRIAGPGLWHAFEFWGQRYLGQCRGELRVRDVPAHGCKLLALRPATGMPQLVGTNLHLLGGLVGVRSATARAATLEVVVDHFMQRDRTLTVWQPEAWPAPRLTTNAVDWLVDTRQPGLVTLHFNGQGVTAFTFDWRAALDGHADGRGTSLAEAAPGRG